MAIEYFNAYHSYLKSIEPLNDAERGRLFTALLEYSGTGTAPELRGNERFIFPTIRQQIDRDKKKYAGKCAAQAKNARMRWHPDACQGMPTPADDANEKTKTKTKAREKAKTKTKAKTKRDRENGLGAARFRPPTADEVSAYCAERRNGIDGQAFVDFYAARGWSLSSGVAMKDWRAAVRTWEKRDEKHISVYDGHVEEGESL